MATYDVLVIGTGGTGTFFVKEFSRFLYGTDAPVKSLTVIDGDVVEEKNIERQSFQKEDVGRPKALVMAEALNDVFALNWQAYNAYVVEASQVKDLFGRGIPFIVGCVDNHACRLVLEKVFRSTREIIYLDAANEFSSGEVVFAAKRGGKVLGPCRSYYFKDILKGDLRPVTEIGCEELNNVSPQHIATNMMAGNILLSEVCNIFAGNGHCGFVSFDAENFSSEFYPYEKKGRAA